MQKEVKRIVDILADEQDVSIVIFGSTITMYCNISSDLDIAVKTKNYSWNKFIKIRKLILKETDINMDILYYNDLSDDDRIKKEIDEKGCCMKEMG